MYFYLGQSDTKLDTDPAYIVVMSGGGIPSESGLMRTYMTAEVAHKFKTAKIIVTMPGDYTDTLSSSYLMKKELVIRGIDENRIIFENRGTNTRSQALEVGKLMDKKLPTLLVTSPEHMYRSLKSFQKIGFTKISGQAAFSHPVEASFLFEDNELGGNNMIPNIGNNTQLRYQFWSHLNYQIIVYREYVAIAFYKIKGWL
ncbi:YdcF family protein [Vicingus serpentipes]|uniref:YdcF family protein n=1 Tax=Vicingus serpentipes TaxID=1926625 RepID=A0A5C6RQP8_9FLAO|nr:YdcF family protein [Vicingus serpentipes]TXB64245.1 YdcF family protein [Vicingus serpentipes]